MKIVAPLIFLLCTGCVSVKYNGGDAKTTKVDYPPIGQTVTAYIGDNLVQKGLIVEESVLSVNRTIDGVAYDIPEGIYKQIGHDQANDFFSSAGVIAAPFSDPFKALSLSKKENSKLCVVTVFGATSCYSGDYEKKTKISERGTSFQQTLIYSGRVGNKINVGYREFSNNAARPAFNNDVEYDLATSSVIGYKGAQLEVIKADNNSITYRLIRNFP